MGTQEIWYSEIVWRFPGLKSDWDSWGVNKNGTCSPLVTLHQNCKFMPFASRGSEIHKLHEPHKKNMTYIYIYVYICDIYQSSCWLNLNPRCPIGAVGESRGPAAREHPQLGTGKTRMPQAWRRGFLQGSGSTAQNFW
jgi:hypothetical protein